MMITLVLIYLILLCLYYYVKLKDSTILIVKNYGQVIVQIVFIFVFFIFFIFFLRILRLFQYHQSLDLTLLKFNQNLILYFIFVITFRKLVIYFFKITWFKFHYVMISETNFSLLFNKVYTSFFYNIVYIPAFYSYKYLVWVNYVLTIGLFLSLGYDLLFNKLVLDFFLYYLKYYSLFKLVYVSYKFMATRQNLILDYYSYNLLYPGVVEESFFLNFDDLEHKNLMQESKKYTSGVILEKSVYIPKYLGNTAEMPYFKYMYKNSAK